MTIYVKPDEIVAPSAGVELATFACADAERGAVLTLNISMAANTRSPVAQILLREPAFVSYLVAKVHAPLSLLFFMLITCAPAILTLPG